MLTNSDEQVGPRGTTTQFNVLQDLTRLSEGGLSGLLSSKELSVLEQALSGPDEELSLSEAQRIIQSKLVYLNYGEGAVVQEGLKKALFSLQESASTSKALNGQGFNLEDSNTEVVKLLLGKVVESEAFNANQSNSAMLLDLLIDRISDSLALLDSVESLKGDKASPEEIMASLARSFNFEDPSLEGLEAIFPSQDLQELLSLGVSKDEEGNSFIDILLNQVLEASNESLFKSFGYSLLDLLRELVRELQSGSRPAEAISRFVENLEEILETAWFEFSQVFEKGLLSLAGAVKLGETYEGESFASLDLVGLVNSVSKNIGLPGDAIYGPVLSEINELSGNLSQALDASGLKVSSAFYSKEFDQAITKLFKPSLDLVEKLQAIQEMLTADQRIEVDIGLGALGTLKIKTNTEEGSLESLIGEVIELPGSNDAEAVIEDVFALFNNIASEIQGDESLAARSLDALFESNDGFDGDLQNLTLADSSIGKVLFEILQTIGSTNSDLVSTAQAVSDALKTDSTSIEFEGFSVEEIRGMSKEFEDSFKEILLSDVLSPREIGNELVKSFLSKMREQPTESEIVTSETENPPAKLGFDKILGEELNSTGDFS